MTLAGKPDVNLPGGAWESDRDYCPTLTLAGARMLAKLRSHPCAPQYRNRSGNKLLAEEVDALRAYEQEVMQAVVAWSAAAPPSWLPDFLKATYATVPYYRACGSPPSRLADVAPISRAELRLNVNNALDKHYYQSIYSDVFGNLVGAPRNVMLTLNYKL